MVAIVKEEPVETGVIDLLLIADDHEGSVAIGTENLLFNVRFVVNAITQMCTAFSLRQMPESYVISTPGY